MYNFLTSTFGKINLAVVLFLFLFTHSFYEISYQSVGFFIMSFALYFTTLCLASYNENVNNLREFFLLAYKKSGLNSLFSFFATFSFIFLILEIYGTKNSDIDIGFFKIFFIFLDIFLLNVFNQHAKINEYVKALTLFKITFEKKLSILILTIVFSILSLFVPDFLLLLSLSLVSYFVFIHDSNIVELKEDEILQKKTVNN